MPRHRGMFEGFSYMSQVARTPPPPKKLARVGSLVLDLQGHVIWSSILEGAKEWKPLVARKAL
jgi:hypothetical protein